MLLVFYVLIYLQEAVKKGFTADEWIKSIISVINGKGGGKAQAGQASGTNYGAVNEAIQLAKNYASERLEVDSPATSPSLNSYTQIINLREKIAKNFGKIRNAAGDKKRSLFGNGLSYYVADEAFKAPSGCVFNGAKVLEWVSFADTTIWPVVSALLRGEKKSEKSLQSIIKYLNDTLDDKTFLVANRISYADVSVYTSVLPIAAKLDVENTYSSFTRWFNTISNHPNVRTASS